MGSEQLDTVVRSYDYRDEIEEMMAPYFDDGDGNTDGREERVAEAVGWMSIALGLTGLFAHRPLARWMGVEAQPALFRMRAGRDLATGIGILAAERPTGWLYARVAGDVADLALLGAAMTTPNSRRGRIAAATGVVAGIAALDAWCGNAMSRSPGVHRRDVADAHGVVRVKRSVTIHRPPEDLYRFWRDFQNLPRVMKHLERVDVLDSRRSHWVAKGPAGVAVEWDAEVTDDRPNDTIAWRSLEGAAIDHQGAVHFRKAPNNEGTVVQVEMEYRVPGGEAGHTLAQLFGSTPEQRVHDDLRPFKQLMETGEIATTEGQSSGRTARGHRR